MFNSNIGSLVNTTLDAYLVICRACQYLLDANVSIRFLSSTGSKEAKVDYLVDTDCLLFVGYWPMVLLEACVIWNLTDCSVLQISIEVITPKFVFNFLYLANQ